MRRVHVTVSGEVQGVGFRYTMLHVAQSHGASGWVRNLRDGRVEAELEGEDAAVASVLEWMSRGPAGAHVTGREVAEAAPAAGDTGFAVRRDG